MPLLRGLIKKGAKNNGKKGLFSSSRLRLLRAACVVLVSPGQMELPADYAELMRLGKSLLNKEAFADASSYFAKALETQ